MSSIITPTAKETGQRRGSDSQIMRKLKESTNTYHNNYQLKGPATKQRRNSAQQRPSSAKKDQIVINKAVFLRKSSACQPTTNADTSIVSKKKISVDYSTGHVSSSVTSLSGLQLNDQVM